MLSRPDFCRVFFFFFFFFFFSCLFCFVFVLFFFLFFFVCFLLFRQMRQFVASVALRPRMRGPVDVDEHTCYFMSRNVKNRTSLV